MSHTISLNKQSVIYNVGPTCGHILDLIHGGADEINYEDIYEASGNITITRLVCMSLKSS